MLNKTKNIILIITLLIILSPIAVHAECDHGETWLKDALPPCGYIIPENCLDGTACEINDIIQVIINVTKIILAIVGSLALIMFIYGGILWLFSQGKEDYINKGKDTLKNAAIGLLIVFATWIIINFVMVAVGGGDLSQTFKLFPGAGEGVEREWDK